MNSPSTDVAIVGAGPYGLSIAAHVRARGVRFRIFGQPMKTWRSMARGMCLKSFGFATSVYTPDGSLTFPEYCRARGLEEFEPCSIADFAAYGVWVQEQVVPNLEKVDVASITQGEGGGFALTLENGERLHASKVIVAVGLTHFAKLPDVLAGLPPALVSHTAENCEFDRFRGKDVVVLGGGQSALEAASRLHAAGARTQLIVRAPEVHFSNKMPLERSLWQRIRAPLSVIGPGQFSWLLEKLPRAAHFAPDALRMRWVESHLGPSGAWWVRERVVGKVPFLTRTAIVAATPQGDRLVLRLREEGKAERSMVIDHVVAGVGYEHDVDRARFLDASLRARVARIKRAPDLTRHFESRTVPGLYFVGPASAMSFGPMYRFVAGAAFTAPVVTEHVARGRSLLDTAVQRLRAARARAAPSYGPPAGEPSGSSQPSRPEPQLEEHPAA